VWDGWTGCGMGGLGAGREDWVRGGRTVCEKEPGKLPKPVGDPSETVDNGQRVRGLNPEVSYSNRLVKIPYKSLFISLEVVGLIDRCFEINL